MNRLWVALLFVLVLALLLTVGLTVTFVYRGRKDKKSDKADELFWTFHLETGEGKTEGPTRKASKFDVLKTKDYSVDGIVVTLKHVEHKFDDVKAEGFAHTFREAVKVFKVEVESKEITFGKAVLSSGFTVFRKDSKADFVTLWHDGDFHHYSLKGELLSKDVFPFAGLDQSKNPTPMNLPKGREVDDVVRPEPTTPTKPKEEPAKPLEPAEPEEPVVPDQPLEPAEKSEIPEVTIDLSLATRVKLGEVYNYVYEGLEAKIVREKFGPYSRFLFVVGFMRKFSPHLKYNGTEAKLPKCTEGTLELVLYTHDDEVPLAVSYLDGEEFMVWKHKTQNEWERVRAAVTPEFLEDVYCYINKLVTVDLSIQTGTYSSGEFDVSVEKTSVRELGPEFDCFTHKAVMSYRPGKVESHFKVFKFKSRKFNYNGLPLDKELRHVTTCFWTGNLERPLFIRLRTRTEELNFVGYRDYVLEKKAELLGERVARVNLDVNRVTRINLAETKDYKFTGRETKIFSMKDVTVVGGLYGPVPGFRKYTHRLSLLLDDKEPFFVAGLVGHEYLELPRSAVSSVEVYFVRDYEETPLMFVFRDFLKSNPRDRFFLLNDKGRYVEGTLVDGDFDFTLRSLAHTLYNAVVIDLTKWTSYFMTGNSTTPVEMPPTVAVTRLKDYPAKGFMRVTHRFESPRGTPHPFTVLEFRGTKVPVVDKDQYKRIEAYFISSDANLPLAVVCYRVNGFDAYLLDGGKYVLQGSDFLPNLEGELELAAFHALKILLLRLDYDHDYYPCPLSVSTFIDVVPLEVTKTGTRKYAQIFSPVSDIRFKFGTSYFNPHVKDLNVKFKKAIVITDDQKTPFFVTLIDIDNKTYPYKYEDSMWRSASVGEGSYKLPHLLRNVRVR